MERQESKTRKRMLSDNSNNKTGYQALSVPFKILYVLLLLSVVVGIAVIQGWLTRENEDDLIELQVDQTCNAVFDAVERGWTEVKLFTETISGGFYADNLQFSQDHYTKLEETAAVESITPMQSLAFVKHLKDAAAKDQWIQDVIDEFTNSNESFQLVNNTVLHNPFLQQYYPNASVADFYMYSFDRTPIGDLNANNGSTFDPIIYNTNWDPFLWGFFPDPEPPRIAAIDLSISTGELACSDRINLFGDKHADNPSGMLCYLPLWIDSTTLEPVPEKQAGFTQEDVYGFVNPVFKIELFLDNILSSDSFGTDIENVVIYAFDVTPATEENFITGNIGNSFMGRYPAPTADEFQEIASETSDTVVYARNSFAKVRSKELDVGERKWQIFCSIKQGYIDDRRSNLPFFIAALSIAITLVFNIFRAGVQFCIGKAQDTITRQSSRYQ